MRTPHVLNVNGSRACRRTGGSALGTVVAVVMALYVLTAVLAIVAAVLAVVLIVRLVMAYRARRRPIVVRVPARVDDAAARAHRARMARIRNP